eukprot:CAMPEP_0202446972 /NCGR_PEP_ID=MMETSP1360-20130828/5575_1 /ASSEMBLY_ACC=CAM_ASM_000848 /TAXON_ID=515479 /ORGANISM="Licmophora paradoxa, Strain CCMP2313" /LENGTH=232 /DNA_ID=CAMNT_0049063765 /DNA_START=301 /DNA_END=999 /DNA_ORIENTATION=-
MGFVEEINTFVIWPGGNLSYYKPSSSSTISQDALLAALGPICYVGIALIWMALYALCDRFEFDESFVDGVDYDELKSFQGFAANVFAQSFWDSIMIACFNFAVPSYPLDAVLLYAACWYKQGSKVLAYVCDGVSLLLTLALFAFSVYDVILDDKNGIGILLFSICASVLIWWLETFQSTGNDQFLTSRTVLSRSCYTGGTVTTNTNEENTNNTDANNIGEQDSSRHADVEII